MHAKCPRDRRGARGGLRRLGDTTWSRAAPPSRQDQLDLPWCPTLALIFTPDEETLIQKSILQVSSWSHHHLCSCPRELIWRLFWPPVRGNQRYRHRHRHSITLPCLPHPCVSN